MRRRKDVGCPGDSQRGGLASIDGISRLAIAGYCGGGVAGRVVGRDGLLPGPGRFPLPGPEPGDGRLPLPGRSGFGRGGLVSVAGSRIRPRRPHGWRLGPGRPHRRRLRPGRTIGHGWPIRAPGPDIFGARRMTSPIVLPAVPGAATVITAPIVVQREIQDGEAKLRTEGGDGYAIALIGIGQICRRDHPRAFWNDVSHQV
jgi:hypothetical protein